MTMIQTILLPTEEILTRKSANYVIRLGDYHLSTSVGNVLLPLIGMGGKEAIGGRLFLTNYRLIFQAHAINRVQGTFSIFLPTIRSLQNASVLIVRKLRIATGRDEFDFVLWGIPTFIEAIRQAQSATDHPQEQALRQLVATNLEMCLQSSELRQVAKALIQDVDRDLSSLETQNSFDVIQLLNIQELFQCVQS